MRGSYILWGTVRDRTDGDDLSSMLRFIAPHNLNPMAQRVLPGAYLIGPDSVPIAGEVVFEDNLIRCEKGTREAAAVAIQIDLDAHRLRTLNHN